MLADRIMQLDHHARGRVMFGVDPVALPSDAFTMGIPVEAQRDRMDEAIGVLVPLLRGETVTHESDWFTLREGRLQLMPYTRPHVEICVASQVSPAGARAAGKHGLGLLSIGATMTGGFNALATNWAICAQRAADFGQRVERNAWRLVAPMHIAETKQRARENVRFGLDKWLHYFREVAALPLAPAGNIDDAIAQLERIEQQSGGYGCFLQLAHNWADFEQTKRSFELIARYVMPRFQTLNHNREASMAWAAENRPAFMGAVGGAIMNEMQKHAREQQERAKIGKTDPA